MGVRLPTQWGCRADSSGNVDNAFMAKVQETVDWANKHGLVAKINAHHEDWFDDGGSLARLVNIWSQVSSHFKDYPDNKLVFEIFNEPHHMSLETLNRMNAAVLSAIRKTNPTRLVFLGGLGMMGRGWITGNPNSMTIPRDANLGLTVHSYDPWSFAGNDPRDHTFSDSDAQRAERQQDELAAWAKARGVNQVVLNEFGVTVDQPNRAATFKYYDANTLACVKNQQGYAVWDSNSRWRVLNRNTGEWDEEVLSHLAPPILQIGSATVIV